MIDNLTAIQLEAELDYEHETKRMLGFNMLDTIIDRCVSRDSCPISLMQLEHYLIDLSVAKYIELRAYYYSVDGIGEDDTDRYLMSRNRILSLIACGKGCDLEIGVFDKYWAEIDRTPEKFHGIRNRKAYWNYLRHKPHNNPGKDYEGACGFVEGLVSLYRNRDQGSLNNGTIGKYIDENMHLINGVELFMLCRIFRTDSEIVKK